MSFNMKNFEYHAPTSIEEACQFLSDHPEDAKPLAGGASLIPLLKLNLVELKHIVDLKRIPNLSYISMLGENNTTGVSFVEIGTLTTHSEIETSNVIKKHIPLLYDTARGIGHPLVRNRGTIGGSLCHCDPAADYPPTMLSLEAKMSIVSRGGNRRVLSASDFFKGTFETSLEKGEVLEKIIVPATPSSSRHVFQKLMLGHGDFPLVVISVLARFNLESAKLEHIAISLGGVSDKAYRLTNAENYLLSRNKIGNADFENVAKMASDSSKPESDLEVSKSYKRRMVGVLTRRSLQKIFPTDYNS